MGLHHFGIAAVNLNLTGFCIQHRITAEEFLPHALLHVLPDLVKLGAHQGSAAHRCKILPVHNLRHMVGSNGTPMGNPRGTVLIAAGISPIGIPLGMSDENRHIAVIHILVHQYRVSPAGSSQIHQMIIVFTVMVNDLMGVPELVKQLISQYPPDLLLRVLSMKPVGADQQNVLLLYSRIIQFLQNQPDGNLSMGSRLLSPLYPVREDNRDLRALVSQLGKGLHAHGIADGLQCFCLNLILRNARGIRNRLPWNKHICRIRQLRCHHSLAVLKCKLHKIPPSLLSANFISSVQYLSLLYYNPVSCYFPI